MFFELPCKHGFRGTHMMCPRRCHHLLGCYCTSEQLKRGHAAGCDAGLPWRRRSIESLARSIVDRITRILRQ